MRVKGLRVKGLRVKNDCLGVRLVLAHLGHASERERSRGLGSRGFRTYTLDSRGIPRPKVRDKVF